MEAFYRAGWLNDCWRFRPIPLPLKMGVVSVHQGLRRRAPSLRVGGMPSAAGFYAKKRDPELGRVVSRGRCRRLAPDLRQERLRSRHHGDPRRSSTKEQDALADNSASRLSIRRCPLGHSDNTDCPLRQLGQLRQLLSRHTSSRNTNRRATFKRRTAAEHIRWGI